MKSRVPNCAGFIAPWLQIFSAAYLTSILGWFLGCAAFVPACGLLGSLTSLTKGTERNVSHGFAAGSMFFIVATFFYYLVDQVFQFDSIFYYKKNSKLMKSVSKHDNR